MSNPLSLVDQHARYRALSKSVVEGYLKHFPNEAHDWWQVTCYESREVFGETFPDRVACNQMLNDLEEECSKIEEAVGEQIDRIMRDGLTYEDLELLRYEFPLPDEEEHWE